MQQLLERSMEAKLSHAENHLALESEAVQRQLGIDRLELERLSLRESEALHLQRSSDERRVSEEARAFRGELLQREQSLDSQASQIVNNEVVSLRASEERRRLHFEAEMAQQRDLRKEKVAQARNAESQSAAAARDEFDHELHIQVALVKHQLQAEVKERSAECQRALDHAAQRQAQLDHAAVAQNDRTKKAMLALQTQFQELDLQRKAFAAEVATFEHRKLDHQQNTSKANAAAFQPTQPEASSGASLRHENSGHAAGPFACGSQFRPD